MKFTEFILLGENWQMQRKKSRIAVKLANTNHWDVKEKFYADFWINTIKI